MSLIFYGTTEVLDDNDNVFNGTTPQTTIQVTSGRFNLFCFALPQGHCRYNSNANFCGPVLPYLNLLPVSLSLLLFLCVSIESRERSKREGEAPVTLAPGYTQNSRFSLSLMMRSFVQRKNLLRLLKEFA